MMSTRKRRLGWSPQTPEMSRSRMGYLSFGLVATVGLMALLSTTRSDDSSISSISSIGSISSISSTPGRVKYTTTDGSMRFLPQSWFSSKRRLKGLDKSDGRQEGWGFGAPTLSFSVPWTALFSASSTRQQQQRRLADKYHPDKEDVSCTIYFANGTSVTVSAEGPPPPRAPYDLYDDGRSPPSDHHRPQADNDGVRSRWGFGWGNGQGRPNGEGGMPPPCRGSSSTDGAGGQQHDDDERDDFFAEEQEEKPPTAPPTRPHPATGSQQPDDNVPAPASSPASPLPADMPATAASTHAPLAGTEIVIIDMESTEAFPAEDTASPGTGEGAENETDSEVAETTTVPLEEQTQRPVAVAQPPPLMEETQPSLEQQQQTDPPEYYYSPFQEENGFVENIVRVAVSIALPPALHKGIPREVERAVTKLMNVTAALRSEDLLDQFLDEYDEHSSVASMMAGLLQMFPVDDIPYIIPPDQTLLLHTKYSDYIRRQRRSNALYWELVNKKNGPIPVFRNPPYRAPVASARETDAPFISSNATNNSTLHNTSTMNVSSWEDDLNPAELPNPLRLATWFVHPISYRCYERDAEGNMAPLTDPPTLNLIETQLQQWLSFHVNVTHKLLEKLHHDHALGIALPGGEYDVHLGDDEWSIRPPPHSSSSSSSSSPSSDEADDVESGDLYDLPKNQGTYTEPLLGAGQDHDDEKTARELAGVVLLSCTAVTVLLWSLLARAHRAQEQEHALWGNTVNSEDALQELLNVGWSVRDQVASGEEGPRQVLVIYDRRQYGMGYRDDDSMLQGGIAAPIFALEQ